MDLAVLTNCQHGVAFIRQLLGSGLAYPSTGLNEEGYELDVYWQAERFAIELDVYETHGSREALRATACDRRT
jgi:hypothetical protein